MKFEYLEDVATADIAFRAQAKNLNELFEICALATSDTMVDVKTIKQKIKKNLNLESDDLEQLLVLFLSELVYLKDAELLFFSKFEVKLKGNTLKAKILGDKYSDKMKFKNDVKAITMHLLKIEKKKETYFATVVLDI